MTPQTEERRTNLNEPMAEPDSASVSGQKTDTKIRPLPFVTLWQDESGVIQVKLGNDITAANAVALLELGAFRYKAMLLPGISPRPSRAPQRSEPTAR